MCLDELISLIQIIEFEEEENRAYQFYCSVYPHLQKKEKYNNENKKIIIEKEKLKPKVKVKTKDEILRDVEILLMGDRGVKK